MSRFQKHLFFCVNERPSDNPKSSCSRQGSAELAAYAKQRARGMGMQETVRINKAGCLDACAHGPAVVVYPEGVWYSPRTQADVDEILSEHIQNNRIVERLLIRFDTK